MTGDVAVLAVPMAVLRRLPITPAVPAAQRAAWQRSGLAHNAKLHLPLNRAAGDWAGLMEGALRSGRRAAAEVLAVQPADR